MRLPLIRPLLLALTLSLGTTAAMTSHAQTSPAYAIPSDGTLLNVSAQAEASRVPDIATISAGASADCRTGNSTMTSRAISSQRRRRSISALSFSRQGGWRSPASISQQ